jgi:hypothetical protein
VCGRKSEHGNLVRHPGRTRHAGTRWVTERIASPDGEEGIRIKTEMTGTNDTAGAVRLGGKRPRQLLRKEKLADGDPFPF